MKLMNPTLTIQNMEGPHLAVTMSHNFDDIETITFTMKVPRGVQEIGALQKAAVDRAVELLQTISNKLR